MATATPLSLTVPPVSLPRQLPAGSSRSLPMLDAVVEVLRAAGEDVHVVYAAHGDVFKIVLRGGVTAAPTGSGWSACFFSSRSSLPDASRPLGRCCSLAPDRCRVFGPGSPTRSRPRGRVG